MGSDHNHRISTYKEAEDAIKAHEVVYVNDCFCRGPAKEGKEAYDYCGCPIEVCMGLSKPGEDAEFDSREIPRDEALELMEDWKERGNLFRFMADDSWICFCCSCGCGFFRDKDGNKVKDPCDKAPFIEKTDMDKCNLCDLCIDVCAYDARSIVNHEMIIDSDNCYGCSACEFRCPEDAVTMIARG